jgi:hypothetical protein
VTNDRYKLQTGVMDDLFFNYVAILYKKMFLFLLTPDFYSYILGDGLPSTVARPSQESWV